MPFVPVQKTSSLKSESWSDDSASFLSPPPKHQAQTRPVTCTPIHLSIVVTVTSDTNVSITVIMTGACLVPVHSNSGHDALCLCPCAGQSGVEFTSDQQALQSILDNTGVAAAHPTQPTVPAAGAAQRLTIAGSAAALQTPLGTRQTRLAMVGCC